MSPERRSTLRSDAIDQLLTTYLEVPARVSWEGALADRARGRFDRPRLELAGFAVAALPFDRLVLEAEQFQFVPGLPARFIVTQPRIVLSLDQRQIDRWLKRARAPFTLQLVKDGAEVALDVAGLPITRVQAELSVQGGWFVLKPKHAELFGLRNPLASLFRSYLPLPRLAPQTRLERIEHRSRSIRLVLALDDFEDEITPGLTERTRERFIPFARPLSEWATQPDPPEPSGRGARRRGRSRR